MPVEEATHPTSSAADTENKRSAFVQNYRRHIAQTGGLSGSLIYNNMSKFEQVWPELKPAYDAIKIEVDKAGCTGCALNKKTSSLLEIVLKRPATDLSPIDSVLVATPHSAYARKLLKGELVDPETIAAPANPHASTKGPPSPRVKPSAAFPAPAVPPSQLWSRLDQVIEVFPEKEADLRAAYVGVVSKEKKAIPEALRILKELSEIASDGRDISKVKDMLTGATRTPMPRLAPPPGVINASKSNRVRKACLNCTRKHLAQAIVLLGESLQGYPQHRWLAVGHLAEASEECLELYPGLAAQIREERLKAMDDNAYIPDLMDFFDEIDSLEGSSKLA